MNTVNKKASLETLGLPSGDHWVRFHVEGDSISFEVTPPAPPPPAEHKPTGFVRKWGATARKVEDAGDAWLTHINEKHLR